MARAHCEKHKRFVPTCEGCKSAALRETVGFPAREGAENACNLHPDGCPEDSHKPVDIGDIPDYEPDEPEVLPPVAGDEPDIDKTEAAMAADGEFDPDEPAVEIDGEGNVVPVLTPGEGAPEITPYSPEEDAEADRRAAQMSLLEMAMFMFPQRLTSQGITPFIEKALFLYLEAGLMPEDAVICVASEVIHAERGIGVSEPGEPEEALTPEELEEGAFDAGLEAAPEITGCIEDYNQGFNHGMDAARGLLTGYYSGDEDAVAFATTRWLEEQMRGLRK